jgi:hypothetical protein
MEERFMETQNPIANPESNPVSVKEQLRQEIEQTPDEILAIALEFMLFLKSRSSDSQIIKPTNEELEQFNKTSSLPYRPASGKSLLDYQGGWVGDDFEECLQLVYDSRSQVKIYEYE